MNTPPPPPPPLWLHGWNIWTFETSQLTLIFVPSEFLGACFSQIVSKILVFYLKSGYVVYIFVTCCNISVLSHKWLSSVPGMRIITIGSIPLNLHICMGGKSAPCWNFIFFFSFPQNFISHHIHLLTMHFNSFHEHIMLLIHHSYFVWTEYSK